MKLRPSREDDQTHDTTARELEEQANWLGNKKALRDDSDSKPAEAVEARFVTHQDPVIRTADGGILPAVPVGDAVKLNNLRKDLHDHDTGPTDSAQGELRAAKDGTIHGVQDTAASSSQSSGKRDTVAQGAPPTTTTDPLFPPLPHWGPPSIQREIKCYFFRSSSYILSLGFLFAILVGSIVSVIFDALLQLFILLKLRRPAPPRPFHDEENRRAKIRREENERWVKDTKRREANSSAGVEEELQGQLPEFVPLEGGPDPLICDGPYYARCVGLDMEKFDVQTEDGFIITLWHLYNPRKYRPLSPNQRRFMSPNGFSDEDSTHDTRPNRLSSHQHRDEKKGYPVLLMHGLLQSGGAYCCNDDESLAFYLAKSGYDVWIGNNRCGFHPRHNQLQYSDPRMWAWAIRQMGVLDLPALIYRVLEETGFEKLGLVCHSQGSTQTFVALAKEQRPEIGDKISVFCALAPAAYAGPLIEKSYFMFMRILNRTMFRLIFGIHAFIPFMMQMHRVLPGQFYGDMGYRVFSFLFGWTDTRWDKGLRNRMFQFSPVYVSAESIRWWLGRECFAKHKCILSTRKEGQLEDEEDKEEDEHFFYSVDSKDPDADFSCRCNEHDHNDHSQYAWFDEHAPPFALWVAGADELVDGRRLLRRFERGREPFVQVVHKKIIEGYEHLDVIWAMDSIEKVGKEVKEVLWRTAPSNARVNCRTPTGCENVEAWQPTPRRTQIDSHRGEWANDIHGSSHNSSLKITRELS